MTRSGGTAAPPTAPHRAEQLGVATRLTTGWPESTQAASLRRHTERYGPLPRRCPARDLIDAVGQAVLTGRGGAAFPTGTKLRSVAARRGPAVVVANGVLVGGYFGSWHQIDQVAALPLAPAGLRAAGASPGAAVLLALQPDACGLTETARVLSWLAGQGAGQCGPCAFGLPAIRLDEWGFPIVSDRAIPHDLSVLARRAVRICPELALRLDPAAAGRKAAAQ
jgi:NADH:ubiquinone oxidoreductase subunit F (NADH-binding)